MASYLSKPADYGSYTQPINLELINFVMGSKQQKYDYNLAKLEDKITNQLGSIDLERAQDKEYFLQRASEQLSSMGDLSKLDYSQNGVTKQIDARLNSIVDDKVLNDAISTRNYRSFQRTIQDKQMKDPDAYSEINVAHAMELSKANDWLRGTDASGKTVDSVGSIRYQDYVDVSKELTDIAENLPDYARVVKQFKEDGFYFITREGKQLTPSEVKNLARTQLSDKAKAQMRINGWYNNDGGDSNTAAETVGANFSKFAAGQIEGLNLDIAEYEMKAKALEGTNPDQANLYAESANALKGTRDNLKGTYDKWGQDPNKNRHNMTTTMEMESVLNNFGNTYKIDTVGDPVLSINTVAKFKAEQEVATARLALAAQKLEADAAAASGDSGIQVVATPGVDGGRSTFTEVGNAIETDNEQLTATVSSMYASLPAEQQSVIRAKASQQAGGDTPENRLKVMDSSDFRSLFDANALAAGRELARSLKVHQQNYGRAVKIGFETVEAEQMERAVEEYYDNPSITAIDPATGKKTSVAAILKANGIGQYDGAKLNQSDDKAKKVRNIVLKGLYADLINSERGSQREHSPGYSLLSPKQQAAEDKLRAQLKEKYNTGEGDRLKIDRLEQLFIEDGLTPKEAKAQAKSYLDKSRAAGTHDTNNWVDKVTNYLPWGTGNLINPDNSVQDDSMLKKWVTLDKVKTAASVELNKTVFSNLQKAAIIPAESESGLAIARLAQSEYGVIGGAPVKFSVSKGMSITLTPIAKNMVRISGLKTDDGKEFVVPITVRQSDLPKGVLEKFDLSTDNMTYHPDNMQEVARPFSFIEDTNTKELNYIKNNITGKQEIALLATKQEAKGQLRRKFGTLMGTEDAPTKIGVAIDNLMQASNLEAALIKVDDGFHKQIVANVGGRPQILYRDKYPVESQYYESTTKNIEGAPGLLLYAELEKAFTELNSYPNTTPALLQNILKYYGPTTK